MSDAIQLSIGALLVSSFFSFFTMGIVAVAAWSYFQTARKDGPMINLLVVFTVGMSIMSTVVDGVWIYSWAVDHYGDPTIMAILPISPIIEIFLVGFTSLLVQVFYAWRVWRISNRHNVIVPGCICVASLMQFAVILWVVWYWATHRAFADLGGVIPIAFIWLAGSILADVLITGCMMWYLRFKIQNSNHGIVLSSRATFNQIIARAVQANVLSLISQVMTFILYKANLGLYFFLVDFTIVKVYTFSLLCSLNARTSKSSAFDTETSSSRGTQLQKIPRSASHPIAIEVQHETNRMQDHDRSQADSKVGYDMA
ncbi:hypothetical protein B0H13DRAFT_2364727 [Mycena leptocephala]|nr:hypothetical protein B0H13DRAFT_2364727 [Mycena leptocephala]